MTPVSNHKPAGGRPAHWTAAAGVALILAVSVAAWWAVGPQPNEGPLEPATMAEQAGGVAAVVIAVAATVALVAAARAGRMDLRWRPTVVALSLAGALSGAGVRFWDDWLAINLFFIGPLWLALVVYGLLRIPPYDPPPRG